MLLSILIPTIEKRHEMLQSLLSDLRKQIGDNEIEIIVCDIKNATIGDKRNRLLNAATGEYLVFIDDDDTISDDYIYCITQALEGSPDCCSLNGIITTNGHNPKRFVHSIKYNSYFEKDNVYYRPPNHLNVIRSVIAKQFTFPTKNFGEDTDWAMQICKSGMLKTEVEITDTLYYYVYLTNK
jgi:glycosyltransferase involved in cell wall biosynthesis